MENGTKRFCCRLSSLAAGVINYGWMDAIVDAGKWR